MSNEWQDFLITIRSAGMEPPVFIIPGKIHRFPGEGKNHSNRAGRCRLFDDGLGGCFGDFSSGLSRSWQAKRNQNYNASEILAFKRKLAETRERNRQGRR
jgi:putative DNA primase/helicase